MRNILSGNNFVFEGGGRLHSEYVLQFLSMAVHFYGRDFA